MLSVLSVGIHWWHPLCFDLCSSSLVANLIVETFIKSTKRGGFYGALERDGSERTKDDADA
jgi:hypothetical protein